MENENNKESSKENIEEVTETKKTTEDKELEKIDTDKKAGTDKNNNLLVLVTVALVIILIGLLFFIAYKKYPKMADALGGNQYGFDYNINNIKSYDWDLLLTDKKVARAMGVTEKSISSAKDPDYAWLLTEPKDFLEAACGSILEQKFLYESDDSQKSLLNISLMICKDTTKTGELFDSRKEEIQNVASEENGISIQKLDDVAKFGTDGYYYLIEKKTVGSEDTPETSGHFAGLIFKRGPFIAQIEESDNPANGIMISEEKFRDTIAQMIDMGIKRSLSVF